MNKLLTNRYYSVIHLLVFVWFVFLPLVFWPRAVIPYEIPRVWFVQISSLVLFSFVTLTSKKSSFSKNLLPIVLFLGWLTFTSVNGADFYKSLVGNYYRRDGLLTMYCLLLLGLSLSRFSISTKKLSGGIFTGSILVSLFATVEFIFGNFLGYSSGGWGDSSVGATFGQPNFLAGYLAVTMPFGLYLLSQSKKRVVRLIVVLSLILIGGGVLVTNSLGGLLAVGLGLILWLGKKLPRLGKFVLGMCLVVTTLLCGFYYYQTLTTDVYPDSRLRLVRQLSTAVSYRPITGWGVANVDYAFESNSWPINFQHDIYVDKAHSQVLEVLVTSGVIGLVLYLLMIVVVLKKLMQDKSPWSQTLLIVLLVYLFHSQTNVISVGEEVVFWLVVGTSFGLSQYRHRQHLDNLHQAHK